MPRPTHYLTPLLRRDSDGLALRIRGRETPLASNLEGAFDSASRNRGLLGRDHLDPDAALVIAPCSSIHTFFMRFPIDVLYTSRAGEVLKIVPDLRPWRISLCPRAFAVVEMAAGAARRAGLKAGDVLHLSEKADMKR